MRILFDHQVFSWQTYGGVSRYFAEQIRELKALGQEVLLPDRFFSENVYLRQFPDFHRKSLSSFTFKGKKWLQNALGRQNSVHAIVQKKPDVFHPTYFDTYFLKSVEKRGIPFVLTVHDMIHEIYGHGSRGFFSLDAQVVENKRILAERAAAVIAVSENTRQDLLRFCPQVDPDKIHVIHHGNSLRAKSKSQALSALPLSRLPSLESQQNEPITSHQTPSLPYLLFIGQRKAYKNFLWMLEHLSNLLRSEPDLHLVCVGGSPFDNAERTRLLQLGVANKVHYRTVASDAELSEVYSQATCFIFPSQYEGFGIPVLEAFACGCPAVLNYASSLPEVGGDAAAYFEEDKPNSLDLAVRRILNDSNYRNSMVEAGLARAQNFTWAQSATKHLNLYQSIVK